MLSELAAKRPGLRFIFSFLLVAVLPSNGGAQTAGGVTQLGEARPEALTLLKQVGQRYANAAYYRIEAVTEEQVNGDFSKNWNKSLTTAVLAPGNKYHFEAHTNWEWWVLVSDGMTEWLYNPARQEYKKQIAPVSGVNRFESSGLQTFLELTEAQDTIKDLAELPSSVRVASYLPDETLTLNGKQVGCYVIDAQGKYHPGWSPDTTFLLTIWVDKENHAIRKLRQRMEGPLIVSQPQEHYVSDKTTVYPIVELDAPGVPDSFFAFAPPSTAKLVKEFEHPTRTQSEALIVGKPAPDVSLTSLDGKTISLKSFQGKPVLLDFWATWCGPCVESMPSVKRLNSEAAKYGLILLSIDEDDDAKKAADFLSENKEPWPNFHDDGEIVRLFPNEGIPHFVLIDSAGRVIFSKSSFDEPAMRAAIAGLGPEFATITKTSDP
jgi:thiol-disulfide isomerase/thioredoxin/outer membrane lipoprotein-sorting protein